MQLYSYLHIVLCLIFSSSISALPQSTSASPALINHVTIFTPPANYTVPRTLYARTVLLSDGTILATWENYGPNNNTFPHFPIYQSTNGGASWSQRSNVYDQVNGWGLRYQPFLYELKQKIGNFAAGTVLLAGNSIPDDLSQTQIDLYASTDKGYTWKFVSHIAHGGRAIPNNGETPVWEPFLMVYKNLMVVYYSDQRDPAHGQKLVHQVSSDLLSWGTVVNDVAYSTYSYRPGMTTVSLMPNGNYIMTYEFYGAPEAAFAVYYRISSNPLNFNAATGIPLITRDGTVPIGSPYNVWTSAGNANGTLVVSCGTYTEVYENQKLGASNAWVKVATPESVSYTRSLLVLRDPSQVLIAGAGVLNGQNNKVTASSIQIGVL